MFKKQLSLIFFLIIQFYIYVMLMSFPNAINSNILVISSTLVCLILGGFLYCKTKDYYIMITSLVLTLLSDIFYLLFDLKAISLFLMNIIQVLYFLRIYVDTKHKKFNLLSRIIASIVIIPLSIILLKDKLTIEAILWVLLMINLFINIIFTIKEIGIDNSFPIGLILLFIFNSFIMFYSFDNYFISNFKFIDYLEELSFDVRFMFYLPAQVVLTCSIFTVNRRQYSKIKLDEES